MITNQTMLIMNWNSILICFSLGIVCFLFDFIIHGFVFFICFIILLAFNWNDWELKSKLSQKDVSGGEGK